MCAVYRDNNPEVVSIGSTALAEAPLSTPGSCMLDLSVT